MTISLSKAQKSAADVIYVKFTGDLGWNHIAATGVLSAALAESSLGVDWRTGKVNVNLGGDLDPVTKEPHSLGLWQIQASKQLAAAPPKGPGIILAKASIIEQCHALDWMLRHGAPLDQKAGRELRDAKDPTEAAFAMIDFERPRDRAAAEKERVPYALFFDKLYGKGEVA